MSTVHALFPGSFDPPTLGHVDLVLRALSVFGRVTVALANHPEKHTLFDVDEREALLREALAGRVEAGHFEVVRLTGLVVDGCKATGATVLVRGVRSGSDFDYELQMAGCNRAMPPHIDTLLLTPAPEFAHISSTLVRQIASMGGDVTSFVPRCVADALERRYPREERQ